MRPPPSFDPAVHVSPFEVFRAIADGTGPLLVDLRPPGPGQTLRGAIDWPTVRQSKAIERAAVVLLDDDGTEAAERVRRQAPGATRWRALYGGLRLYAFALDPGVVGERFLVDRRPSETLDPCGTVR